MGGSIERAARRWRARGGRFVDRSWSTRHIDRLELTEDGLQVFRGAVAADKCRRALAAVLSYVRANPRDPTSWSNDPSAEAFRGLVPLHHPQAFWDVRQDPSVHAAFADVWKTDALWVTIDRASFRAPGACAGWLHHDVETPEAAEHSPLQGLVYLTDCGPFDGPLQCVPETFKRARDGDPDPLEGELDVLHVPGRAGDLVVWHPTLLHGPTMNRGGRPRVVQYVGMAPVPRWKITRSERVQCWRDRMAPEGMRGYPGQPEREPGSAPAELTSLGRRLLGLDEWPLPAGVGH